MNWRMQCLTPTLIGDGSTLSPIDYMVWKDAVNVLDQRKIFKLLSNGPRLEGYLNQIKRAEKLDFASWGGFAQTFAQRRIAFDHASYPIYWERAHAENCHIPTFSNGLNGPYIPASALKGALRTVLFASKVSEGAIKQAEQSERRFSEAIESQVLGKAGNDVMRNLMLGDSAPASTDQFRVYMLRTATLAEGRNKGQYTLGWKQTPKGTIEGRRVEDATPAFAEMAAPGATFEGSYNWRTNTQRKLTWPVLFKAANDYAEQALTAHKHFAQTTGLTVLSKTLDELNQRLEIAKQRGNACLLSLGWSAGFLGKTGWPKTEEDRYRGILGHYPVYERAIRSGMPFPKTRRIVFLGNNPAALPGWVWFEVT